MTIALSQKVLGIVLRDFAEPKTVSACMAHRALLLTERPIDCALCCFDLREFARLSIATNKWLSQWREDMVAALHEVTTP